MATNSFAEMKREQRYKTIWNEVLHFKDAQGEYRFEELATFANTLLILLNSNADVERLFSSMNVIKNKQRNRMKLNILTAILKTLCGLRLEEKCCNDYEIPIKVIKQIGSKASYKCETDDDGAEKSSYKRHRSSSSLAGAALERTRSERKMDQNASIPELDQFTIAEGRCDDLQEKIDTIKLLKKRTLKKRSMTRISETKTPDMPFRCISTPKAPKKTRLRRLEIPPNPTRGYLDPATVEQHRMIGQVRGYNHSFKHPHQEHVGHFQLSQDQRPYLKLKMQRSHADGDTRLRRLEIPPNPTRGYLDPATVEQHRMIGQVRGYNHSFKHPHREHVGHFQLSQGQRPYLKLKMQRSHADGDSMCSQRSHASDKGLESVACGQDEISEESGSCVCKRATDNMTRISETSTPDMPFTSSTPKSPKKRRAVGAIRGGPHGEMPALRRRQPTQKTIQPSASQVLRERPVVELFKKSPATFKPRRQGNAPVIPAPMNINPEPLETNNKVRQPQKIDSDNDPVESMQSLEQKNERTHHPRRVKYRTRGYEMPTISSQIKHAGVRTYGNFGHANITFVVSKSTAPSHNIGVKIQQVLNGVKIQQPVSGIPLTIAHHMGLGHVPSNGAKTASQSSDGPRGLRLRHVEGARREPGGQAVPRRVRKLIPGVPTDRQVHPGREHRAWATAAQGGAHQRAGRPRGTHPQSG